MIATKTLLVASLKSVTSNEIAKMFVSPQFTYLSSTEEENSKYNVFYSKGGWSRV